MSTEIESRRAIAEKIISSDWNNQNSVFQSFAEPQRILINEVRSQFSLFKLDNGKYSSKLVSEYKSYFVAGRIIFIRSLGKIIFVCLRDESGEIQVQFSPQHLSNFDNLQVNIYLNIGDIISVKGLVIVSKTGELTLAAESFSLLTKSYQPIPIKQSISNQEILYRQRYLDFLVHPEKLNFIRLRSFVLRTIRSVLDQNDFLEVETPTLHHSVGGASARPFITHHNDLDQDLTLRVAPELYLKRMLVSGLERVYEIGRCYRNESIDSKHNPEFTSVEFYWAYISLPEMINFVHTLLAQLLQSDLSTLSCFSLDDLPLVLTIHQLVDNWFKKYYHTNIDQINQKFDYASYSDLLAEYSELGKIFTQESFDFYRNTSHELREYYWFENFVQSSLQHDYTVNGKSCPIFVIDFPIEVSPLAKSQEFNAKLADRFELYINGMEVGNSFQELNDPDVQANNFKQQLENKNNPDAEYMDFDADYIAALEFGMPPAVGCGIGIDRLVMLLAGQTSIKEVIAFPPVKR